MFTDVNKQKNLEEMSYARIVNFGPAVQKASLNNPLTYCAVDNLDALFNHTNGAKMNADSESCQNFMSDYCATNWDEICEASSKSNRLGIPNMVSGVNSCQDNAMCYSMGNMGQLSTGEILLRNTAAKKYMRRGVGSCAIKYVPFDPLVPTSPMISVIDTDRCGAGQNCVVEYEVDPKTIDSDPVMNKILNNPGIALDILMNIYFTAMRYKKLDTLKGTRVYNLFVSVPFQQIARQRECTTQMGNVYK